MGTIISKDGEQTRSHESIVNLGKTIKILQNCMYLIWLLCLFKKTRNQYVSVVSYCQYILAAMVFRAQNCKKKTKKKKKNIM